MERIRRFLLILVAIVFLSGCVNSSITTKINNDKSMNLEVELLTKDEYKNTLSATVTSDDLELRGFKITTHKNGDYSGFKITRTFKNIDELCNANKDTVDIADILEPTFDFTKLFNKTSSFFKDTYTANIVFTGSKLQKYNVSTTEEETEETELKYNLVVPSKVGSNNANDVSSDKKYLTWKLSTKDTTKINYSFDVINMTHIIIVGVGALVAIILIIVMIIVLKKKKATKATLIYKEYDPSIEGELNKNEVIEGEATKVEEAPAQTQEQTAEPTVIAPVAEVAPSNEPVVVDTQNDTIVAPETPVVEETPEVVEQPVPAAPAEPTVPEVETATDNMGMQSLPSLEFEAPENTEPEVEEVENDVIEVKANTYDFNRRPDFVKSYEPSKFVDEAAKEEEQEIVIEPPIEDNLVETPEVEEVKAEEPIVETPEVVEDSSSTFIVNNDNYTPVKEEKPSTTPELDIPDAIAFSDMDQTK